VNDEKLRENHVSLSQAKQFLIELSTESQGSTKYKKCVNLFSPTAIDNQRSAGMLWQVIIRYKNNIVEIMNLPQIAQNYPKSAKMDNLLHR